jgi:hypothetical protein
VRPIRTSAVIVIGLLCVATLADSQPPKAPFKSSEANAAIKEADVAEAKARADFDKAMVVIRARLIEQLTTAKDKATRAGDLDEALKLRDKINELKWANVLATPGVWMPGDWKVAGGTRFHGILRLSPEGAAQYVDHPDAGPARWTIDQGHMVITWSKLNAVDTYTSGTGNQMTGSSTSGDALTATRVEGGRQ